MTSKKSALEFKGSHNAGTAEILIGKAFGRLTVIAGRLVQEEDAVEPRWLCQCRCGSFIERKRRHLIGYVGAAGKSCGCAFIDTRKVKQNKYHGHIFIESRQKQNAREAQRAWYKARVQKLFEDNCK